MIRISEDVKGYLVDEVVRTLFEPYRKIRVQILDRASMDDTKDEINREVIAIFRRALVLLEEESKK